MKKIIAILLLLVFCGCKSDPKQQTETPKFIGKATLKYAKGFEIEHYEGFTILKINSPWPKSEKNYKYLLLNEETSNMTTIDQETFDGTFATPIKSIVVTSTTHIPALELLGEEKTLVGFPGTDYISSETIRERIDHHLVRELGKNEGINTEVLLELRPDVVIGFGIDGNNKTFETIKKSGIPVIYNGDWVETSPLAKAEWVKLFGVLYNKEKEADSIFNDIEKNYLEAKSLAVSVKSSPTILSGALEKDVWYLPNGTSPEAQLLKDANTHYLWSDTKTSGSLALSFEVVFEKAKNADIWISPSYHNSFKALQKANEHYTHFNAYKSKNVYSFVNTKGATGGVTYYELGTARPDLVLKDLVKICHPELLNDYEPHFFKRLE